MSDLEIIGSNDTTAEVRHEEAVVTSREVGPDSRSSAKKVYAISSLEKERIEYEARHRGTTHGDFPHVPGGPA